MATTRVTATGWNNAILNKGLTGYICRLTITVNGQPHTMHQSGRGTVQFDGELQELRWQLYICQADCCANKNHYGILFLRNETTMQWGAAAVRAGKSRLFVVSGPAVDHFESIITAICGKRLSAFELD